MRTTLAVVAAMLVLTACTETGTLVVTATPTTTPPTPTFAASEWFETEEKFDEVQTALAELPLPWEDIWTDWGTVDEDYILATRTTAMMGEPEYALLAIMCAEELRATEVRIALWFEEIAEARDASDEVDDIFISRRSKGEMGRWMKSGWQHWADGEGFLVLSHRPAGAFIDALASVGELAVMVTYDHGGNDSGAVFDVRYLSAALDSPGWACK